MQLLPSANFAHSSLKIAQDDLLARCFEASDLLQPCESTLTSLEEVEPAYSVNFEFTGNNSSLLRLEAEFAKRPGAQEYEVTQRRWLRPRKNGQTVDGRPPLQIGVVDFERYTLSSHDGIVLTVSGRTGRLRSGL